MFTAFDISGLVIVAMYSSARSGNSCNVEYPDSIGVFVGLASFSLNLSANCSIFAFWFSVNPDLFLSMFYPGYCVISPRFFISYSFSNCLIIYSI